MQPRDIIVIGGSAGSLDPIREILGKLPGDLRGAVFVVVHTAPRQRNYLCDILKESTPMAVVQASEDAPVENGTVYVAPSDKHLVIRLDHIQLSRGPKEGLQRPSINVTFRSAAAVYADRVVGVLLSGILDDGAAGMWEIARRGGVTIVQDPAEAPFPSMPLTALNDANVSHMLGASEIGQMLVRLVNGEEIMPPIRSKHSAMHDPSHFTGFTCPECRGPMYENGEPPEFRCHVGHVMSLRTLFEEHTSAQERKLYEAILALREGADLADRVAAAAAQEEQGALREEAKQLRKSAEVIQKIIEDRAMPPVE